MRKYDFSQFPSSYPLTVKYSAISHVRGHLHMSRLRKDKFYILTYASPMYGPDRQPCERKFYDIRRGGIYEWTMADQAKLVERALSETPFLPEKEVVHAEPARQEAMSG